MSSKSGQPAPRPAERVGDDEQSGKKPKPKGRKPFAIECRYAPEYVEERIRRGWSPYPFSSNNDWRVWRRYRDEKARDRALENLRHKYTKSIRLEFRAAEGMRPTA